MSWLAAFWLIVSLVVPPAFAAPARESPQHLYDKVMEEFHKKDYEAALAGFRFFLELHGRSSLASSAQYWVGECEYRLGRYRDAVASFEKVMTRYPDSPKLPDATYKKAVIYEKLGLHNESRILLERILVQFPNTQAAELAKKSLHPPQ